MNTTDRFDDQLAEHLRTDAPREAPAGLLDATMSHIADTPQRGAGWLGSPVVRLLAAAAVLVLAVVAGTQLPGLIGRGDVGDDVSPSPSASPVSSASASASPSSEPSADPAATPVGSEPQMALLNFIALCDVLPPVIGPSVSILNDGRVIWNRLNGDQTTTLSLRRLNAQGLAQVTDAVTSTGLFEADGTYDLVRQPGTPDPPGHGLCRWVFDWAGEPGSVQVESTMWLGDQEESTYYEPAPQRFALHELAVNVQDPEAWIDAVGWEDPESTPFVPTSYLVLAGVTDPQIATDGAPDVDSVAWPFDLEPDAFGEPIDEGQQRCGIADADAIDQLTAELSASGLEQFEGVPNGANVTLPWASRNAALDLFVYPQRPDGEPPCDGSVIGRP